MGNMWPNSPPMPVIPDNPPSLLFQVNSTDIEEATVEFQHPCIDRALAAASGGEQTKAPQARSKIHV